MKSNLEILLGEWGKWKRGENRSTLGYPNASAFVSMRVDGQRRTDPYALLVDDDLRRLDAVVTNAAQDNCVILTLHYVREGVAKVKQSALRISAREYYRRLLEAQRYVGHTMGGKYSPAPDFPANI